MSQWWVHRLWSLDPILLFAWIFWVILSITLHELGHGFAAIRQGDPTPRALGRMTVNPAVHIPPFGWLLFALLGITWGLMPIDPRNFRHGRLSRAIVAAAGPAVNVVLAFVLLTATVLWDRYSTANSSTHDAVLTILEIGGRLNLVLALFNLLPLPPLDGSAILAAIVRPIDRLLSDPAIANYAFAALFILGFMGAFDWVFRIALWIEVHYTTWLLSQLR